MLKKVFFSLAAAFLSLSFAWAQVDVNKADQAALDGIKGIGPSTSKAILEERKKGGDFKDWDDLQKRVKGVGEKSSEKLSQAGLTVNGVPKSGASKPVAKKVATKAKSEK